MIKGGAALFDAVQIYMNGNQSLYIENYKGLIHYTDQLIRIQAKKYKISVVGQELNIAAYTNEEMQITGFITDIRFEY
ncbi:sporulation protein [Lachnotalea sp. AF33-28]|jgi:sporulation protein YqfC|nr:sporulation protein [Lachnotalea sp. AF33-28]